MQQTNEKYLSFGEKGSYLGFVDIQSLLSISKGWTTGEWEGNPTIRGMFGGNEIRFRVANTSRVEIELVTESYVWIHIFIDDKHFKAVSPESKPVIVNIPIDKAKGNDIRILRSSVSSGPFYVDVHLIKLWMERGGEITEPLNPVPSTVFCTFGDSISGNSLVGDDQPFDPFDIGYGWLLCKEFGWQYLNTARDGSGLCCRLFENPLAQERVRNEVIVYRPDYIFILYGTNDLAGGANPFKEFSVSYERLLETLVKGLPKAHIVCSALLWRSDYPEDQIKTFSKIITEKCQKFSLPYCQPFGWLSPEDFYDGLHPNPKGHKKIADNLKCFFKEIYPELRS